jgi:methylglutaconyl-CoA hydratase
MQNIIEQGYVRTDVTTDGTAHIQFYHPNHNSLPSRLQAALVADIEAAGHNPDVRCIVLKSTQHTTFCAGASFDELSAISDEAGSLQFFSGFGRIINAMRSCPKVIIVRVHGKAVGGGVGIAAAADLCFATKYASIRLSELAVGFGPFIIGPAIERKMGVGAFGQMALTPSEWRTAAWAKERGLFQEVLESDTQLDGYIDHVCQQWQGYSLEAMTNIKAVLWQGTEHWDTLLQERAGISARLALTDASKKAIASFKNK